MVDPRTDVGESAISILILVPTNTNVCTCYEITTTPPSLWSQIVLFCLSLDTQNTHTSSQLIESSIKALEARTKVSESTSTRLVQYAVGDMISMTVDAIALFFSAGKAATCHHNYFVSLSSTSPHIYSFVRTVNS
jgi:hypothetical protein